MRSVLGTRAAAFIVDNLALITACTLLGLGLGIAAGAARGRLFLVEANLEVGARVPNEWLENPIIAAERWNGHLQAAARAIDPGASVGVTIRRDKNRAMTRYLDGAVFAHSSSAAESILDRGTRALIDEHQIMYAYERTLVESELAHQQSAAERLKTALEAVGQRASEASEDRGSTRSRKPPKVAPLEVGGGDTELLSFELHETHKIMEERSAGLAPFRAPPTHVVFVPHHATPLGTKMAPSAIAGLLLGLLAGLVLAGGRAQHAQVTEDPRTDPIIRGFLIITRRRYRLIVVLAFLGLGAGLAAGFAEPARHRARAVVQCATIGGLTIENLEVVSETLQRLYELPPDGPIQVMPLVGPPPSPEQTSLLEMFALGPSPAAAEGMLAPAAKRVIDYESPLYSAEETRISQSLRALEEDLTRTEGQKVTAENHELALKLYREIVEARRSLSPARSYAPRLLSISSSPALSREEIVGAFALAGLLIGVMLAYAAAFVAGRRGDSP